MPSPIPVRVRRMRFAGGDDVPRYWHSGSPFLTHFFTALSLLFPGGEKFFIESVKNFEDEIQDPVLREEIAGFVKQEALHSHHHRVYNRLMTRNGVPVRRYEERIDRALKWAAGWLPLRAQLAFTITLEHFTAVFAHELLTNPKFTDGMHPDVKAMWLWHAVEETEHKAVAYDVYQQVGGQYWLRWLMMLRVMVGFPFGIALIHTVLMVGDRAFDPRDYVRGLRFLWGRRGFLRTVMPELLHFYRRDFHPWQFDNRELVESWTAKYGGLVTR